MFVLDTNILLDLIRLDKELTDKALACFKKNRHRILIPYYVGLEYHKHFREEVIKQHENLKKASKKITDQHIFDCLFSGIKEIRFSEAKKNYFKTEFQQPINKLIEDIKGLEEYYSAIAYGTELQDKVAESLDKLIFDELTPDDIAKYEEEGKSRYEKKVPPGFMDNEKRDNKYGDFIIWKEILNYVSAKKVDICFVSRDLKKDWLEKYEGRTLCPRYELQREFQLVAPDNYFKAVTLDRMMELLDKDEFSDEELHDIKSLQDPEIEKQKVSIQEDNSKGNKDENAIQDPEEENEMIAQESTDILKDANKNDLVKNVAK